MLQRTRPLTTLLSTSLGLLALLGSGCTTSETAQSNESTASAADPQSLAYEDTESAGSLTAGEGLASDPTQKTMTESAPSGPQLATFGAGCYWCVEAVYDQLEGVTHVRSGFMGGHVPNATYSEICTGTTGHAEVCEVTFDPAVITYEELLDWFWRLHDPTTLNRQGNDVGTQYRSAIFYHSEEQRQQAEASKQAAAAAFADPIVTEITEVATFYTGPEYHQDYYTENKSQGYCRAVIKPKLEKLDLDF